MRFLFTIERKYSWYIIKAYMFATFNYVYGYGIIYKKVVVFYIDFF